MEDMFDWEQRDAAFSSLRRANAARLLERLQKVSAPPARLLDIGCAEGWFVRAARDAGYDAQGLEPDDRMAKKSDPALNIRTGFFPAALQSKERFDIITFNDVFEHLPNVRSAMSACITHLNPGGMLVINLPNALGGIYRISRIAARLGFTAPFGRMWQEGYPSPHLTYFTPSTLRQLAQNFGLNERACFALPAIEPSGLWGRIRCDRSRSFAYSLAAYTAVMSAMPLLAMMPPDIAVQIFEKSDAVENCPQKNRTTRRRRAS